MELRTLEKLLALVKKHGLAELEVESGRVKYRIKTALGVAAHAPVQYTMPAGSTPPSVQVTSIAATQAKGASPEDRYTKVLSPFVGTFYRAPSPEAESYVKEGQMIKKGDVLCIVEAMKLMNEIESEVSGKVVSVLAENGQPVEYGEPLFLIDAVK